MCVYIHRERARQHVKEMEEGLLRGGGGGGSREKAPHIRLVESPRNTRVDGVNPVGELRVQNRESSETARPNIGIAGAVFPTVAAPPEPGRRGGGLLQTLSRTADVCGSSACWPRGLYVTKCFDATISVYLGPLSPPSCPGKSPPAVLGDLSSRDLKKTTKNNTGIGLQHSCLVGHQPLAPGTHVFRWPLMCMPFSP